jgi:hypothetical protein
VTPAGRSCRAASLLFPTLFLIGAVVWTSPRVESRQAVALPARLDRFVREQAKLSADDYQRLLKGGPVTASLPTKTTEELSVFGAIWIDAPIATYIAAAKDVEHFYGGSSFPVTKQISTPPRLEDFDRLTLVADDVNDLRTCRVESCELKLGEEALRKIQTTVDWTKPLPEATRQVESLVRTMALEFVVRYEKSGNEGLAVYRDRKRPTFVAREFQAMVEQMPVLTEGLAPLKTYLLGYPNASLPGATSLLFWQIVNFGLRPTIRVNHLVVIERPQGAAVVTKMLYANHYFWTALELHLLVPDAARGRGFWLATISQSRSDGLSGFAGPLIRYKVRDEVTSGALAALTAGKAALEGR